MQIALRRAEAREQERLVHREPGRWGLDAAALALPANETVLVDCDAARRVTRARRQDVFDLMRGRGKLGAEAHDAIRRLQDDIAMLHRAAPGSGDYSPRVDRSRTSDAFTETRRRASSRIETALGLAGPASARLLGALCEAAAALGGPTDWRILVQRETGETLPDAQGAVLRGACENLAGAYAIIDRRRRRTAASSV